MLFGDYFRSAIQVLPRHDTLARVADHFHGAASFAAHGFVTVPFMLAMAGVLVAGFIYLKRPDIADRVANTLSGPKALLDNKYFFDNINQALFAGGARQLGGALWRVGDEILIDGAMVNGTAKSVGWFASIIRHIQSGYLYHYAFAMIIGLAALLGWLLMA